MSINQKGIYVAIAGAAILLLALFFIAATLPRSNEKNNNIVNVQPTSSPNKEPVRNTSIVPTIIEDQLIIKGIKVKNFIKNENKNESTITIEKNDRYELIYQPPYELFNISILKAPFLEIKKEAEEKLKSTLNIDADKMCLLEIQISTQAKENSDYIQNTYRPDGCASKSGK